MKAQLVFTNEEMNSVFQNSFTEIMKLRQLKGGEYAGDVDALANFRRNAEACGVTMETCWRIYAGKHWDAVSQYVADLQPGKSRQRLEGIEGRIDDLLVYLLIFKCMILEKQRENGDLSLKYPQEVTDYINSTKATQTC